MSDRPNDPTSATLLVRLRSGEAGSWERLTRLYGPLVRYWCRRWGVAEAELDDVAQEIWAGLGPRVAGYRAELDRSFRAWLRGVTRHKAQDWHRQRARRPADAAGGTAMVQSLQQVPSAEDDDDDAEDSDEQAQRRALHGRALAEIRGEFEDRSWRIFLAVAVDGRPAAEVASEFGISPAGVRKVKSRMFHRLRMELGELMD